MKFRVMLLVALSALLIAGCASYTASMEPDVTMADYRRFWVRSNLDDNHGLDRLIVQILKERGFEAEFGPLTMMPAGMEALVTYRDRWSWDFTSHMTALEISVADVKTERMVATANFSGPASLTTSPREAAERLVRDLLE